MSTRKQPAAPASPLLGWRRLIGVAVVVTQIVFLDYRSSMGLEVIFASSLVSLALLLELMFGVRENAGSPADVSVLIFNWLFLDLAPKIQLIGTTQQLVNTSSVADQRVAFTFSMCALFIIVFTCCYALIMDRDARHIQPLPADAFKLKREFNAGSVGVVLFLCVLTVGVAAPVVYHNKEAEEVATPASLVLTRFACFLPSACLLILLNETVRSARKVMFSRLCVLGVLFLLVAITENPFTERRNALGPVYLALILTTFQNWFSTANRRLMLLMFALVLIFPAISIFTHRAHAGEFSGFDFNSIGDQIQDYYYSINYDSWANIYSSIEIVARHGAQWGQQLLGSFFFFVPSAIWTDKRLATGIFLGNYLSNNYGMWFTNLSAPLVAEGYLDFGVFGVAVYAFVLAFLVRALHRLVTSSTSWAAIPIALYFSIFLVFMLRGSLMIAVAYGSAALAAFGFSSWLLSLDLGARGLKVRPSVNASGMGRLAGGQPLSGARK